MVIHSTIILYSTGCPKCKILKERLNAANISFVEISDRDTILQKGIDVVPVLEIDGERINFSEAILWINNVKGE